jgi:serine/threonine protein kinase
MQMINIVKYIHSFGYIHRDLKPDNFVTGFKDKSKIYCIDFGLSKSYLKDGEHLEFETGKSFCGTCRYSSISAHLGISQSRKDDLESIAYILIYLFKGSLPWMGVKHKDKLTRYKLIGEMKQKLTEDELTCGMPREFTVFLKYVRRMDYLETPPYKSFYKMFYKLYKSKNYKTDVFDYAK